MSIHHQHDVAGLHMIRRELTRPTVTKAEPVFQPTRENWFENQYSGRLYLSLLAKPCVWSQSKTSPSPSPLVLWCWFKIFIGPSRITDRSLTLVTLRGLDEIDEGLFGPEWCHQFLSCTGLEYTHHPWSRFDESQRREGLLSIVVSADSRYSYVDHLPMIQLQLVNVSHIALNAQDEEPHRGLIGVFSTDVPCCYSGPRKYKVEWLI